MSLDHRFPTLADLRRHARRRIPRYLWDYMEGGAGNEAAIGRATAALDAVTLMPGYLAEDVAADLSTQFLGRRWSAPFGIAPVGMSGAIWPGAETLLAETAVAAGLPYCLSTVAAATPEEVGPSAGSNGWFQLYPAGDPDIRRDLLARAKAAGFQVLVLTVDVAALSRRPRELRHRLTNPMRLTPRIVMQSALCPAWSRGMIGRETPRPRIFDPYVTGQGAADGDKHIGITLRCAPDWAYLDAVRAEWDGPLIVKGVLDPAPARRLLEAGVDGLWVSAHGGRQFEAAPAPVEVLPGIRAEIGPHVPVICDGGIRSGTDVLRALALGADFVMLGRGFHYGLGAAGAAGAAHVAHILSEEMRLDMGQMGITRPIETRSRLIAPA